MDAPLISYETFFLLKNISVMTTEAVLDIIPVWKILENFGYLFYIASPNRTSFEKVEDVPDYLRQSVPYFTALFFLEQSFMVLTRNKKAWRINDTVVTLSQGFLGEISRFLLQGWGLAAYVYVHSNWKIIDLPWNWVWTWWIAFFTLDFFFYWGHRACHEIHFFWAAHQVHHSSEDLNMFSALRQSIFQTHYFSVFYLPMALIIPPGVFMGHNHFNLMYQYFLHTESFRSMGPLEYILNTASHHRVHHGRNRYCIDKNYAGVLIIWDRMFGTFEPEKEEVVYGHTHPINTFQPYEIQMCIYKIIWRRFWEVKGWRNKLSVIAKGPGWSPGTPWCGNPEDIPDVKAPMPKYDPPFPFFLKLYSLFHFIVLSLSFYEVADQFHAFPPLVAYGVLIYDVISVNIFACLLEGRIYGPWLELLRCLTYFALDYYFLPYTSLVIFAPFFQRVALATFRSIFVASTILWLTLCVKNVTITVYYNSKKMK